MLARGWKSTEVTLRVWPFNTRSGWLVDFCKPPSGIFQICKWALSLTVAKTLSLKGLKSKSKQGDPHSMKGTPWSGSFPIWVVGITATLPPEPCQVIQK